MSYNTRETKGRCRPCSTTYQWTGVPKLRDARCPRCRSKLGLGRLGQPGKLLLERPATRALEASP